MKPVRHAPGLRPLLITLMVVALPATAQSLSSVTLSPTSVTGGATSTGTVTLSANAPSGGKVVALSSANTGVATVPASVTVASGTKTKTFTVSTVPRSSSTTVVISGVLSGVTKTRTLTVKAPATSAASVSPTSVTGGTGATLTVTLTGNAPAGGTVVTLTSGNTQAATLPASVTVLAGAKTATAAVATLPVGTNATVVLTATAGGSSKTASLTVKAPAAASHTVSPGTVAGTLGATGTVTLNGPAPSAGAVVTLSSNNTSAATVPSTVTVLAGATTASFPITTLVVTSRRTVTLSAVAGGATKNATLYVDPPPVGVASVSFDPPAAVPGSSATGTVTLTRAPSSDVTVALASSRPADVVVPASLDVLSGQSSGTFAVTTSAGASPGASTVTATLNGTTAQGSLELVAPVVPALGVDLVEADLSAWQGFAETPYVASVSAETTRVKSGQSSIRFTTDSGFDCGVRYVVPAGAHWDLRGVRFLTFWSFGDNTENYQGEQPVVVFRGPGGSIRFQPPDVQTVNGSWRFHRVPLGDASSWIVSTEGEPSLGDITSFEIHQDTWGMGMTVFFDGVAFASDVPEDVAEGTAALWGTFSSDHQPASVVDDSTSLRSGASALRFDTASGFDTGLVFPKSGEVHWDLSDVKSVVFWIEPENDDSFQGNQPVLLLRSPSGFLRYEPGDVLVNAAGWRFYEVPLDGSPAWNRTQDGTPDLADVTAIEIHGDTWGYGFRFQVDGVSVGRPLPLVVLPAPSAPAGTTVTASVHLSDAAPSGGRTVLLESSDSAIASVPASVVVPEGARSASFPIETGNVTNQPSASISASDRGILVRTSLRVDPVVDVTSVTLDKATALGGQVVHGLVTIATPAGAGGVTVLLTSSDPAAASVPPAVPIEEGAAEAAFDLMAAGVASSTPVSISASAGAATAAAGLTVVPAPPLELASVSAAPAAVVAGDWLRVSVVLTAPAPAGGHAVALATSAPELLSLPSSVLVPAGEMEAGVDASTSPEAGVGSVTVTATDGPIQRTALVTLLDPTRVSSLWLASATVLAGDSVNGTVQLTTAAPLGGFSVTLASSSPDVTVPPLVTVPAGSQSVSFVAVARAGSSAGQATLSASARGVVQTAALSVVALAAVTVSAAAAGPGVAVNLYVSLSAGVPAGRTVEVALVSSNPAVASVPATATIAAGHQHASVAVTRVDVASDTTVDLTAAALGASRAVPFVVEPMKVRSVSQANGRTTIASCASDTLTVTLNGPAPAGGSAVDVTVTGGSTTDGTAIAGSSPPARRIAVPAGASSIGVSVRAGWTASPATLVMTARLGTSEASGALSVSPGTSMLYAVPENPARGTMLELRLRFPGTTGCVSDWAFWADVVSSDPAVVPVASPVSFDYSHLSGYDPTEWRAMIPVPTTAASGTTRITVAAKGATAWVDVTVPEASLASLDLSPSAAPAGAVVLGHVTLDTTASLEGTTVLLSSSDSGIAAVPSSVLVAPGKKEAVFTLTPQTVSAAADVVVTASVAGQSKAASFRALPTDAASFTGTVLDAGDWDVEAPLSGATAAIASGVGQFLTGLDGAFHLYTPSETASVAVSRQAFATTSSTPQSLSPGQAVDLGEIRLKRTVGGSCTAIGRVITPQGAPIEGATGVLEGYDVTYVTNAIGEYTVSLPFHRSRYRMTFSKAGYPAWTEDLTFVGYYPVDCLSVPYLADLILDPDTRPALSSVSFLQPTAVSGGKVQVRPILAGPAPPGGAKVSMTLVTQGLYGTSWRSLPIPGGQTGSEGSFEATLPTVEAPTTVTFAFFYGGVTKRTSIEVVPETLSISCPNNLTGATTAACTLSLRTGPAPAGGAVVALTSSDSSLFTVPGSATVPQGQTSVAFPLTIGPFFGTHLSATLKGLWAGGWGERSISAFRPDVDRISISPTAVVGGGSATGTVILRGPAYPTGQTTVTLEGTLPAINVPVTVTVAPGESSATFPIATTSVSQPATGSIRGRLTMLSGSTIVGAEQRGGDLLVTPPGLGIACAPSELVGGQEASCQVSLPGSPAPAGGTLIALTSPSGVVSVPASVTVPEGMSSKGFTVRALPVVSPTNGVVRATLGTEMAEVTLAVRASSLRSFYFAGGVELDGGFPASATVSLDGTAPGGGILVALSVAGTAATVPPSVLIPEGDSSASFPVTTVAVSTATDVVLTATHGSVSLTSTLLLNPQTWRLSPLAPGRVIAGAGGVTLYGRDFLPSNTIQLSGPVYSFAAPDVPLCDEPAGACPAVDASDATVVFQYGIESGNRIVFTVPAFLSPGYYTVRAKSAAGTLSSEARWLLLDDPSPVVPDLAPEQHGLARPITSGQAVTGTFVENGDTSGATNDFNLYYFVAAAGTRVSVRLERADASLPWEHPDSLDPKVALIAPDGFVYENLNHQDVVPATDLNAEITDVALGQTGMWLIAASTSRGHGGYRLTYAMTPPGSVPLDQRVIAFSGRGTTAPVGQDARLTLAALDPRGYPLSGAGISFIPYYPDPVAGHVEWPEGQGTFTAVDGLAQCTVRATTPGAVDIRPNLLDVNGIVNALSEDPAAQALFQTALEGLPSYQPLAHHTYAVRDVDPDGSLSLDLGPVRAFKPAHPSRLRTEWKTGTGATKALGAKAVPAPDPEENGIPRPLPPVEKAVASSCTELKLFRFEAVAASEVKAPFTVTLADVSPGKPPEGAPIGEKGIEGHRVEKTVRLKIDVRDRDGNTPPHPVLLRLSVGGPASRTGMLVLDPDGARLQCKTAFLVWHDRDAQGNVIDNDLVEYRLGTLSLLPGVEPDPDHPGQVKPVWGVAELLDVTAEVVTTDTTVISRKAIPIRPQPGKPQQLVDWDGSLQDDGWEWWNGFYTYYDTSLGRRAVSLTGYNAYTLVDKHRNTVWGYRDTTTRNVPAQMTVGLPYQETTGPDFRAYGLQLKWWADATDQMPHGTFPVLLVVPYAANEPDWPAGEVVQQTLIGLQGGNQTHLKFYDRYEARFGLDDGEFPMSVSPDAGPEAIPKVGPPVSGAVPGRSLDSPRRLALVLVTGRESPSAAEVFRAPHHPWEWQGTGWVERPVVPVPDPHIDVASKPRLKMKLVDVNGNVQAAAGFKVHFCPRFDHEGSPTAPEWACPAEPVTSTNGVIEELRMNPGIVGSGDPPSPDATGYLGLELTKAPVDPGTYYVYVESLDKDVKVRDQSLLHLDDTPEGQYQGGFALCTVTGAEILDENFQRVDQFEVPQPKLVYVRYTDPGETANTTEAEVTTYDDGDVQIDKAEHVKLNRVSRSTIFLSDPIELNPPWTANGAAMRATATTAPARVLVNKRRGKVKARLPKTDATKNTKCGPTYVFPMGLRLPVSVGRSRSFFDNSPRYFVCSPAAGDCGADVLAASAVNWRLTPLGVDVEGDDQVVRMELEPGESPPQAYMRGIRISTTRTPSGFVTLNARYGLEPVASIDVEVRRPWHLGSRTDGYPVTYPDTDVQLEPIVIDMADRYGIPPQFLMSQVTKEANRTGDPARYNAYSYRYEAYGFDFLYITGDRSLCCDANGHNFLATYHPFLPSGIPGATGQAEMRPVDGFDQVPVRYEVMPQPIGDQPTAAYLIPAGPNGPPVAWDVVVTDTAGVNQYQRVDPGFAVFVGPLGPTQYSVDCRTGQVTFGAPPADPSHLKANYQPARNVYAQPSGLGAALGTAISTAQIALSCPGCDVLPPSDPATTISAWARTRASVGQTLTQTISRYGREFASPQNWYLLQEDPSFDVQGQWYGGASFGLLQVWPENANTTINRMSGADAARIRAIYNPRSEPGTKLFDPQVGVEFGAAGDRYAFLSETQEGGRIAHEPVCVPEATSAPYNNCTWSRYWARRFTAFNAGRDNGQTGANAFAAYGWPVVENSSNFAPVLQPVQ